MSASLADEDIVVVGGIRLLSVELLAALLMELWLSVKQPLRAVLLDVQLDDVG